MDYQNIDNFVPYRVDISNMIHDQVSFGKYLDSVSTATDPIWDILLSSATISVLMDFADTFQLQESQSAELSRIIRDVVLGTMYIGNMPIAIRDRLNIDDGKASTLSDLIARDLFKSATEDIKKVQLAHFPEKFPRPVQGNVLNLKQ